MRLRRRKIARRSRPVRRTFRRPRRRRAAGPRALDGALRRAERTLTPARALALVALAAVICLGASQFGDYRAVEVGAPQYRGVESIAQAPELAQRSPRSAHGAWVLAIAVGALLVLGLAVTRNGRLARLLVFLGAAVVVISLAVDAPPGLREGTVGIAYEGADAVLLGPFWVQLFSGVTLMVVGPLLAVELRTDRSTRRSRRRDRRSRRAARRSIAPSPEAPGVEGAPT